MNCFKEKIRLNYLIELLLINGGTAGECLVLVCVRVHVDMDFMNEL